MRVFSSFSILTAGVGICHGAQRFRSLATVEPITRDNVDPLVVATNATDFLIDMTALVESIGDEVFDKQALEQATGYISAHSSEYKAIIEEEGKNALGNLTEAGAKYRAIGLVSTRMLTTLKSNVQNTQTLMGLLPSGHLSMDDQAILGSSLHLLVDTMKTAVTDSKEQFTRLEGLTEKLDLLASTLSKISKAFDKARDENSDYMQDKITDYRTKGYLSCIATIVVPISLPICYATVASVLEAKVIPELKDDLRAKGSQLETMSTGFETLGNLSSTLGTNGFEQMRALSNFTSEVQATQNLVQATSTTVHVIATIRELVLTKLGSLVEACDRVLQKFQGNMNNTLPRIGFHGTVHHGIGRRGVNELDKKLMSMAITQGTERSQRLWEASTKNIKIYG